MKERGKRLREGVKPPLIYTPPSLGKGRGSEG
jgi:hypothetical protein